MKKNLNIRMVIFIAIALSSMFVGVAVAGYNNFQRAATYLAITSSFAMFIVLLDIRQDRVLKGFLLIATGVIYQLVYPRFFYVFVDKASMPGDLIDHFEIYSQVILLACAGAGGSIIAVYADKTSSDYEPAAAIPPLNELSVIEKNVIENTRHIEQLTKSTSQLNKKLDVLLITTVLAITATGIFILLYFLK
ncbi:hypothetical protein ACIPQ1_00700 [Pseudomonas sp. LARHCG127]